MIFGGRAIFVQKPRVPHYWLHNQVDLAAIERRITICAKLTNIGKVNANNLIASDDLWLYYLFLLPEKYAAYDPSKDEEPTFANRKCDIALRELADQDWNIDELSGSKLHTIWWGHFLFCVMEMDTNRKIIVE